MKCMRSVRFQIHERRIADWNAPQDQSKAVAVEHWEELSDENALRFEPLGSMEKEWLFDSWMRNTRDSHYSGLPLPFNSWLTEQWDDKTKKFRYEVLGQKKP
jgi:hypothetical protein